ncbi:kinase-like domain-containing protein [Mycotypha africana]|uniref:kinase-like domain-containing protein n=1 Tax=Mycotypha africana TaxID=64632 RepID=UPI002300D45B|nr:kinase-like domain-containing protein [Mycotypha africana]KAI8975718.1 kinase-like domain-containing protein [Mycotypha africana]
MSRLRKDKSLLEAYDEQTFNAQLYPGLTRSDDVKHYCFPIYKHRVRNTFISAPKQIQRTITDDLKQLDQSIKTEHAETKFSGEQKFTATVTKADIQTTVITGVKRKTSMMSTQADDKHQEELDFPANKKNKNNPMSANNSTTDYTVKEEQEKVVQKNIKNGKPTANTNKRITRQQAKLAKPTLTQLEQPDIPASLTVESKDEGRGKKEGQKENSYDKKNAFQDLQLDEIAKSTEESWIRGMSDNNIITEQQLFDARNEDQHQKTEDSRTAICEAVINFNEEKYRQPLNFIEQTTATPPPLSFADSVESDSNRSVRQLLPKSTSIKQMTNDQQILLNRVQRQSTVDEVYDNAHVETSKEGEQLWREKENQEIENLYCTCPGLKNNYKLITKVGYGTFGSVFKAINLVGKQNIDDDDSRVEEYVAVKVILDVSSPARIANEINFLQILSDARCIAHILDVFRINSLVFVVLQYIESDDFSTIYYKMQSADIKKYIKQLLIGLESAHKQGIMHRDLKPGNFLYNTKTNTGHLIDFGLARESYKLDAKKRTKATVPKSDEEVFDEPGYYEIDDRWVLYVEFYRCSLRLTFLYVYMYNRPHFEADRSGTRGFRAPELLIRYKYQTTAVDMWAVGVILLIFLTGRYPFFDPEDDADGLVEIGELFGKRKLSEFCDYYELCLQTNIPTIPDEPKDLAELCKQLNEDWKKMWQTEEDFLSAVNLAEQCLRLIHTERITASEALMHPFLLS